MKIEAAAWYACDNIFLMKLFVRDLAPQELARKHAPEAIETLVDIAKKGTLDPIQSPL